MTTQQISDAEVAEQPAAYWTGVAYEALTSSMRPEDDLAEAEVLLERGRLTRAAEDRLWFTEVGEQVRVDLARNAPAIRAALHDGIDDADHVTTLKVLQLLIRNAGPAVGGVVLFLPAQQGPSGSSAVRDDQAGVRFVRWYCPPPRAAALPQGCAPFALRPSGRWEEIEQAATACLVMGAPCHLQNASWGSRLTGGPCACASRSPRRR